MKSSWFHIGVISFLQPTPTSNFRTKLQLSNKQTFKTMVRITKQQQSRNNVVNGARRSARSVKTERGTRLFNRNLKQQFNNLNSKNANKKTRVSSYPEWTSREADEMYFDEFFGEVQYAIENAVENRGNDEDTILEKTAIRMDEISDGRIRDFVRDFGSCVGQGKLKETKEMSYDTFMDNYREGMRAWTTHGILELPNTLIVNGQRLTGKLGGCWRLTNLLLQNCFVSNDFLWRLRLMISDGDVLSYVGFENCIFESDPSFLKKYNGNLIQILELGL